MELPQDPDRQGWGSATGLRSAHRPAGRRDHRGDREGALTAAAVVARSLQLVAERAGDPAPQIYARLFAEFPESEERFCHDVSGAIRAEMLNMAFECLLDPGGPYQANLVRAERVNHHGFGTSAEAFDRFFGVVHETCRGILGGDWTPEFESAWSEQIARVLTASR